MTAKSKSELMKKSRQKKIDAGLVDFRKSVTPEQKKRLQKLFDSFSDK